ncbi:DUF3265 domain-containing protein [Vibrio vulnificus]|nr:DUF3265 domain-containing protein [Vibrio vulnificus]MBN8119787.1 DUF3265 domain-containing protein [Vibrio vulnificus]
MENITKRLSGIWHAWHFQFALSLVVTALCGSFCIACLHPLTRRYATEQKSSLPIFLALFGHLFFGVGNSALSAQILESFSP